MKVQHVIETLMRYLHEQGLIEAPIGDIRELFAPETHDGVEL